MALPDSFIEQLNARTSIEELASSYMSLKRRGRTLVGLCPFHGEKTPSFTVYPDNNSFYCFGCQTGGDVITFVKKIEHLDYLDAVKFLADRAGMTMPEQNSGDEAASRMRRRVLEANRAAARWFHENLQTPAGKPALDYLHRRGYTDKTIRHFGLGACPDDFNSLRDHLRGLGFHDEELIAAWLCRRGQKGSLYSLFRGRVMTPIIDVRGNVVAFGGRVLDDSKPKYINTGDTVVFKKTNNLFGLNFAKDAGTRTLILCEGYMDVIALHQAGFTNAVAALGTSFTTDHANLLTRYADEIVVIFDADSAGRTATEKAIRMLRQTGLKIRVVSIPDGKDPDEFLKAHGAAAFRKVLDGAANDIEYNLMELAKKHILTTDDGKIAYLREATELLAGLQNPIERDVYAGRLSQELGVSKTAIEQQIDYAAKRKARIRQKDQMRQVVRRTDERRQKVNPEAAENVRAAEAEAALIGLLLQHPDLIGKTAEELPPGQMLTAFHKRVYQTLVTRAEKGEPIELCYLASEYDDAEMGYITRLWQAARERVDTPEEAERYCRIIAQERDMQGLQKPEELTDEEALELIRKLKEIKG